MDEFITLTDVEGYKVFIKTKSIVAITQSLYPDCKTAVWIVPTPDTQFDVVDSIKDVYAMIQATQKPQRMYVGQVYEDNKL